MVSDIQRNLELEIMELLGGSSTCYYNNGLFIDGKTGFTQDMDAAIRLIRSDKIFWKLSYEYFGDDGTERPVVRIVDDNDNELAYRSGYHSVPMLMCMAYRDMLKKMHSNGGN